MADGRQISITNKPLPEGGWIVTHEDITERRRADAKIVYMALHDGLTDLANRHLFEEQITRCFERLGPDQTFAVLCLDLDYFKNVNDTLGHPFGDKLLQQLGARLRGAVREFDTVARLGGDEFAILQRNVADPAEIRSLSERIVEIVGTPFDLEGNQVVVGVSIGIALAPTDANNTMDLLKAADLALFRAKADGRSTYRFFESAMDERAQARQALERDLRKALMRDQFVDSLSTTCEFAIRPDCRIRGADPMEPPRARNATARGLHFDCGRNRADRSDRGMGPSGGLRRGRRMAQRRYCRGELVSRAAQRARFMPNRTRRAFTLEPACTSP